MISASYLILGTDVLTFGPSKAQRFVELVASSPPYGVRLFSQQRNAYNENAGSTLVPGPELL